MYSSQWSGARMGSSGPLADPGRLPAPAILAHTPVFPRSVSITAEDRGHGPTLVRQVERGLASSTPCLSWLALVPMVVIMSGRHGDVASSARSD